MNNIIKLKNLHKTYKNGKLEVKAVRGIDLDVQEGEFISIMGASGSGKSTMMNIIGCLDQLTDGKYILDGKDISNVKGNELSKLRNKKIGFVFQSFNLLPKLTTLQNVELPMIYAGIKKKERYEKAMNALDKVGLSDRVGHKPNELSGGQKQRGAIARALVNEPAIILADEPTGNLDSKSSIEIINIFQEININGSTIVMVTHEPEIAEYTKRIVTFRDGLIIEDRPNKQLIAGGDVDEC